jgi:hypothetical protein
VVAGASIERIAQGRSDSTWNGSGAKERRTSGLGFRDALGQPSRPGGPAAAASRVGWDRRVGASAEWAHAGAAPGGESSTSRTTSADKRQEAAKKSMRWVLWPRREKEMRSSPGPKESKEGRNAGGGPASRRLSRFIGQERMFVLPLLRRGRTFSNLSRTVLYRIAARDNTANGLGKYATNS